MKEPRPRSRPADSRGSPWPARCSVGLPRDIVRPTRTFDDVLTSRRSLRKLAKASLRETLSILQYARHERAKWEHEGLLRYSRPNESAGALHSVDVLLVTRTGNPRVWFHDPRHRTIASLTVANETRLRDFLQDVDGIVPGARGCDLLVLAGDLQHLEQAYADALPLLYRDAGALLQTINLCATASDLGSCSLGITGSALLDAVAVGSGIHACGVAVIGRCDPIDPMPLDNRLQHADMPPDE